MSLVFAVEETIDKPVDQVWTALTDWANAPSWMAGIETMQADGETREGTQLTFHARGADRLSVISHCDPGRSITLRSAQGKVTADYTYELHALDTHTTRIELAAHCRSSGILWPALFPLLRLVIKRVDGSQLRKLKQVVETAHARLPG